MKIALTGHTAGIGKELYNLLSPEHEIKVYSRTTFCDIKFLDDQDSIINDSLDCEVFINNAYATYSQCELAEKWFNIHKTEKKLLVNVGSYVPTIVNNSRLFPKLIKEFETYDRNAWAYPLWAGYYETKIRLEELTREINTANVVAKATMIRPGVTDTERILPSMAELFTEMISAGQVALVIKQTIDNWTKGILVSDIVIENTNY